MCISLPYASVRNSFHSDGYSSSFLEIWIETHRMRLH
jgi:hypothetical protein